VAVARPELLPDRERFKAELAAAGTRLPAARELLEDAFARVDESFAAGAPVAELIHERAWICDAVLSEAWRRQGFPDGELALLAAGGYGRGELHPHSDIDLAIVLKRRLAPGGKSRLESFLTFLWDLGLKVGSSVRTVRECKATAKADITVVTNLMEARLIAGSAALFAEVQAAISPPRIWPSRPFFQAKRQEQVERHHRFGDTAENLEPNIKDGPGGLRDIQTICWVAQRHFGTGSIADLARNGVLSDAEAATLAHSLGFIWRVRYALHHITGRAEERLLFDYQREVAELFGYQAPERPNQGVEQFMKLFYRSAMEVSRLTELLLQLFEDAIMPQPRWPRVSELNRRFVLRNGLIEARDERVFERYPFALLEIFLLLQQHEDARGIRASTIRLIRDNLHRIDEGFRADIRARSLFLELLRHPKHLGHEFQRMHRYGVLGAYLPCMEAVAGLMQFDLFHVYTVDQHTLEVVRNVRKLFVASPDAPEFAREIAPQIPKPELLYIAGLFHDIAKGRGGDHSELGGADARQFCEDHGLAAWDTELVCWLVRKHLLMSQTAQRKDIADPAVINEFAAEVRDRTRLNYLYLLTVADIRGTNPDLWTSWKDALLRELFDATARALRRGLSNPLLREERIREARIEAERRLVQAGIEPAQVEPIWADLEDEYFLRHTPAEILWHARNIIGADPEALPLVSLRPETERGGSEIFVYTVDRDYLFAIMTRTLDQLGLDIVDARIITSASGYTLDTYFVLEAATGGLVRGAERVEEIKVALERSLAGGAPASARVNRRTDRKLRQFRVKTKVNFEQDEESGRTVMEVITTDRPGVLSRIGMALQFCGVRLQNARIATYGERAEDIFFLTDTAHRPIRAPITFECLRRSITEALEER